MYVIRCEDQSMYIGHTDNLQRRLQEHRAGRVHWTRGRAPLTLAHTETCTTREEAVLREQALKTGFGRTWLKRMLRREGGGLPAAPSGTFSGAAQAGKTVGAGVIAEIVK